MFSLTGRTGRLVLMLVLNLFCFFMELIFGYLSNSMVLMADAFNVLSDFLGVLIALICIKISAKGPNDRNTFGWERCDILGALINSVFMISLCITIFLDAMQHFISPEPVDQPFLVMIVGVIGLLINLIGILALKDYRTATQKEPEMAKRISNHRESTSSKRSESSHMNMHGAYLHILGDAFGSIVVIVCAVVDWRVDNWFLQSYLDPLLSVVVAILLTISSCSLLKKSSLTLLQAVPTNVNLMTIKQKVLTKSRHIVDVTNLHVWQLTGDKLVASVRIRFDGPLQWEKMTELVDSIENCFIEEGIHLVTIQPETSEQDQFLGYISRDRCSTCRINMPKVQQPFMTPSAPALPAPVHEKELESKLSVDVPGWI